jgi:hypothetical protein
MCDDRLKHIPMPVCVFPHSSAVAMRRLEAASRYASVGRGRPFVLSRAT